MQCPACSTVNPDQAAFCMTCGTRLAQLCVSCGSELPGQAQFCMTCGHRVGDPAPAPPAPPPASGVEDGIRRFVPPELLEKLASAATTGAMQGERRTVSMLFCDVQGSTTAAEHMDPEEWAEVMNGAFEHLIAPVYRYEGTLARLMGDAILAFFGAPIAHEDDPERAVRAGLEIIASVPGYCQEVSRRWGVSLDVRVGINTGLVVVGAVGSDLRVEYTAMGDAVNVAARMEQTAAPGTVQVSDATRRLVDRLFEFEPLGAIEVKGRSEPVEAHRVIRALPRPASTRGIEGLRAPMIGRDEERERLREVVDAVASGSGGIVSIMGEAGLGKSRLVTEVREEVDSRDANREPLWIEGRALSYETAVPFASAERLLRGLLGVDESADSHSVWRAIESTVRDSLPGRQPEVAPFIGAVVGATLPEELQSRVAYLEPAKLRSEAFKAIAELVKAMAARRPIMAVMEDLHWADSASIDLVTDLMDVAEQAPIGVVLVFRPRRRESSWAVHETAERDHPHIYSTIALQSLEPDEARTLVSSLLDVDGLPDRARETILSKSDGNPFYLEEVVRSMIDQGLVFERDGQWVAGAEGVDVTVPDTLAAVITTRLDRLDASARRAAQAASVLGREFRYDELAAVIPDLTGIDDSLVVLQRRDILREVARTPKRVFRFRHVLVQETIYETVLLRQRQEMHASIAAFLERVEPDRVEDMADHYLAARRPESALPHLASAGSRALAAFALPEAVQRFERALEILDVEVQAEAGVVRTVLEGLGRAKEMQFDFGAAAEAYARLRQVGEERGELAMALSGRNKAALVSGVMFADPDTALSELAATEAAARAASADESLAEACMYQCFIRTAKAEFDEVEFYMGELTRIGEAIDDTNTLLFGMVHLANTLMLATEADRAIEKGLEALARAEEAGQLKFQAELLTLALPFAYLQCGQREEALHCVERGMEIAMRIGDHSSEAFAAVIQGKAAMDQGHFVDALALFRRAEHAAEATGMPPYITVGKCVTGTCYMHIGGPLQERANELHNETLEWAEKPMGDQMGAWIWSEVGHCALAAGDVAKAEELFTRALDQRSVPMYISRPDALRGLVDVALQKGDIDRAAATLSEFGDYVRSRSMANYYAPLLLTEARVAAASGDHEAALRKLDECVGIVAAEGARRIELEVHADRARALKALGDMGGAQAAAVDIERVAGEIAAGLSDELIRSAFGQTVLDMVDPVKG